MFDEVKRVLKQTGTCWVNLGDTYYSNHGGGNQVNAKGARQFLSVGSPISNREQQGKSLCQIPSRFAIEMTNRGWILRNEIIWWKPNALPAGAKDRFTVDFEKIFFFVKDKRYWFDLDSVREPQGKKNIAEAIQQAKAMGYSGKGSYQEWYFHQRTKTDWLNGKRNLGFGMAASRRLPKTRLVHPLGRAKRCVWSIPTKPFTGKHYAVYPPQLIETPIKAGCPKGGIVLDPFMGSGTTALVARKLGRKFIGIDLNPAYIRMARSRLKEQPLP